MSLRDADISLRRRALDLLFAICHESNAEVRVCGPTLPSVLSTAIPNLPGACGWGRQWKGRGGGQVHLQACFFRGEGGGGSHLPQAPSHSQAANLALIVIPLLQEVVKELLTYLVTAEFAIKVCVHRGLARSTGSPSTPARDGGVQRVKGVPWLGSTVCTTYE